MLVIVPDKDSIKNFDSIKWLIEDETVSSDEAIIFLKKAFMPYNGVRSAKFFVNEDYEVLIVVKYTSDYREYIKFLILTNQEARSFLKIVKGNIEERARKMQKVADGIDQPKESGKTQTKTTPPPEIRLPPR